MIERMWRKADKIFQKSFDKYNELVIVIFA